MIAGAVENVHRGGSGSPQEIGEVASNLWIFRRRKMLGHLRDCSRKDRKGKTLVRRGCPVG
jgi:hypothetical protein